MAIIDDNAIPLQVEVNLPLQQVSRTAIGAGTPVLAVDTAVPVIPATPDVATITTIVDDGVGVYNGASPTQSAIYASGSDDFENDEDDDKEEDDDVSTM